MPEELENSASCSPMTVSNARSASDEAAGVLSASAPVGAKKKRNLPGMPDPNAEVIALSPKTLMATNRFVCEICNKGFQRDQNLQLHRRGHNLPWKLRQRSGTEPRKRVYVCPEPSCVHHDPWRALGDLTGIKKHFCRKHGEKKWKCEKCSKKYAVQSDWKAHSKTCGTKEYRCDCGTLFSRKDSFITHRAFCDALAVESAKSHTPPAPVPAPAPAPAAPPPAPASAMINSKIAEEEPKLKIDVAVTSSSPSSSSTSSSSSGVVSTALPVQQQERDNPTVVSHQTTPTSAVGSSNINGGGSCSSSVFAGLFASTAHAGRSLPEQNSTFSGVLMETVTPSDHATNAAVTVTEESTLLCLSSYGSTLFSPPQDRRQFAPPTPSHMSATALLQKAAQMGVTASNGSLLRALGLSSSSPPESSIQTQENLQWQQQIETPNAMAGLGLGLPYGGDLLPGELMLFDVKPATVDFLGLGMGGGGAGGGGGGGGLSELMSSIGGAGGLDDVAGSFGGDSRGIRH
ncbi:hypothetical protein MRB53_029610 [Persea americana]|uniref:Uncharacterized protein n=1 Tax=Persea americana TaxID=3435 RepID=A0ACC2KJ77_PERAE|nr:hypothetical protein MRB53_029610 [Persea americana]|eukprot:TRINITY_DN5641_c0_g1_i1.p1 TRINITY_DN5641_c0_g1~~TRINITY_DN5641_c0_g1_i1.p1  ORF type:complete len:516 (-),score=90.38 TRINITY_DN5641_c0_g1_i1:178-1725(-)